MNNIKDEVKQRLSVFKGLYDEVRIFDFQNQYLEYLDNDDKLIIDDEKASKYHEIDEKDNIAVEEIDGQRMLVITTIMICNDQKYAIDILKNMHDKSICGQSHKRCQEVIRKLNKQMDEDELTKINNRRYIKKNMQLEINNTDFSNKVLYAVMFDIDNFKGVNDHYGHFVGDEVLRQSAGIIAATLPNKESWIARYGGDEFVIFINVDKEYDVITLLNEMRKRVSDNVIYYRNNKISITMSMGAKKVSVNDEVCTSVIEAADANMYKAKSNGKNNVCIS